VLIFKGLDALRESKKDCQKAKGRLAGSRGWQQVEEKCAWGLIVALYCRLAQGRLTYQD
jgi:hypothetical protein